jgi:hypothetical protein
MKKDTNYYLNPWLIQGSNSTNVFNRIFYKRFGAITTEIFSLSDFNNYSTSINSTCFLVIDTIETIYLVLFLAYFIPFIYLIMKSTFSGGVLGTTPCPRLKIKSSPLIASNIPSILFFIKSVDLLNKINGSKFP